MSNTPRPMTRPGLLAEQLRAARGTMTAKALAERCHWQISKVSKIEHGKQLPSPEDLDCWARETGMQTSLPVWEALLQAGLDARRDLAVQTRNGQRALQRRFNEIIEQAHVFRSFQSTVIPRFLQTPDYTRAILTEGRGRIGGDYDIEGGVIERQASVRYLFDRSRQFEMIITEPVLGWRFHTLSRQAHRQQLQHLLDLMDTFEANGNVRFGIVPLFRPISWAPRTPFDILGDYAVAEHWIGEIQFLLNDEIDRLTTIMDKLWETACEGEQAAGLIRRAIDQLDAAGD